MPLLELDDIQTISVLKYDTTRNHTMVCFKNGEVDCSCGLYLPPMFKAALQLIVGNVDA